MKVNAICCGELITLTPKLERQLKKGEIKWVGHRGHIVELAQRREPTGEEAKAQGKIKLRLERAKRVGELAPNKQIGTSEPERPRRVTLEQIRQMQTSDKGHYFLRLFFGGKGKTNKSFPVFSGDSTRSRYHLMTADNLSLCGSKIVDHKALNPRYNITRTLITSALAKDVNGFKAEIFQKFPICRACWRNLVTLVERLEAGDTD